MSHIAVNLHTAKHYVEICLQSGLVPFLRSSPGIGKSSLVKELAKEYNLELIDLRLSQCDPVDLHGLPRFNEDGTAEFIPFDMFPVEGSKLPKGKQGTILFLDEFNSASRSVSAAAYKLVLDRMVGNHKLREDVFIICAGNLDSDKAITNPMSSALTSRLVNLFVQVDTQDWLKHYAIPKQLDTRVVSYLNMKPSNLMTFDPSIKQDAYASPRTWEFLSKVLKNLPDASMKEYLPLFSGIVGEAVALDFQTYTDCFNRLPSIDSIEKDPEHTEIPVEIPIKWAITTCLIDRVESLYQAKEQDEALKKYEIYGKYLSRMDITFRVLFYRMILSNHPSLVTHKSTIQIASDLKDFLTGD